MRILFLSDLGVFRVVATTAILISSCSQQSKTTSGSLGGAASSAASSVDADAIKRELDRYHEPLEADQAAGGSSISSTGTDEDLKTVLSKCGIPDFSDFSAKTFNTVQAETYTRVIDAGFSQARLDLTSTLTLTGRLDQQTLDVAITHGAYQAFDVTKATLLDAKTGSFAKDLFENNKPEYLDLIKARSIELGQKFAGPVTAKTIQGRTPAKAWKGIVCTIRASDEQLNLRSGYTTSSTYQPAFAPSISPIADKERYAKELGQFRYFPDIKVIITNTNHPVFTENPDYKEKLAKGEPYTLTGSIFIEKIPPVRQIPRRDAEGKPIIIKGDTAYRVTNRFGTNEETLALGFHLWTEYYIDHSQRSFSGFVTEVGDEQPRYFVGKYVGVSTAPNVTYEKDIRPILTQYCVSCHPGASKTDLRDYASVAAHKESVVGRVISSGAGQAGLGSDSMPPNGFADKAEGERVRKAFYDWSQNSFKEK